jgi:glycine hydroxymethyltransferase
MAFSAEMGGHATHHAVGAAGLYGLEFHPIPCCAERMDVDLDQLAERARALEPKLIILAGSLCLFPYSVREVRRIADSIGAYVMYDAAHVGGLIAGGHFQRPLEEGADIMTGSTYKSFGGPPSGFVLTNSAALAERLDHIAFPGLTANFDCSRTAAMVVSALDLIEHGSAYAAMCIANAQALARQLESRGCAVHYARGRGHTASHHVALQAARYGGGDTAANRLAKANILTAAIGLPIEAVPGDANGLRLGTQEVTRWGMRPEDMDRVASFLRRVLVDTEDVEKVREDVIAFRSGFQQVHFIRESGA